MDPGLLLPGLPALTAVRAGPHPTVLIADPVQLLIGLHFFLQTGQVVVEHGLLDFGPQPEHLSGVLQPNRLTDLDDLLREAAPSVVELLYEHFLGVVLALHLLVDDLGHENQGCTKI